MALAPDEIGSRIAERRRELGWTHQKLADEMDVELRTVQRWQKGSLPRLGTLMRLADVMGVEHSYFVEGAVEGQSKEEILDRLATLEAEVREMADLTAEAVRLLREAQRRADEDERARSAR